MLIRIVLAIALVLVTWNPTGTSYVQWALVDRAALDATKVLVGVLLLAGWVLCVRATWVSLGSVGVALVVAILAALVWWLTSMGFVSRDGGTLAWIVLVAIGVLLGVGMGWSLVRQKATGQVETH